VFHLPRSEATCLLYAADLGQAASGAGGEGQPSQKDMARSDDANTVVTTAGRAESGERGRVTGS
jgi:hypothetical protein